MNSKIREKFRAGALLAVILTLLDIQKTSAVSTPFLFFCQDGVTSLTTEPLIPIDVQFSGNPKFYESGIIYNGRSMAISI